MNKEANIMSKNTTYEIDGTKLKQLIVSWGGFTKVSKKIYRSPATLSKSISRGTITKQIANALEKEYGVPYDAYKKQEQKEEQMTIEEPKNDIIDLLRKIYDIQVMLYNEMLIITDKWGVKE